MYIYKNIKRYVLYVCRPKAALAAIKKKMINPNPHVVLYALLVRDQTSLNKQSNIRTVIYTLKVFL